jgi:hypothetical protein
VIVSKNLPHLAVSLVINGLLKKLTSYGEVSFGMPRKKQVWKMLPKWSA